MIIIRVFEENTKHSIKTSMYVLNTKKLISIIASLSKTFSFNFLKKHA